MDFQEAIVAHTKWKMRLFQGIRGQGPLPDAGEVARADRCDLGRWLVGEGAQHAAYDSYREVVAAHAEFHQRAADVVRTSKGGDAEGAEAMLASGGLYALASDAVVLAAAKLRADMERHR
jgi:methyl-accepting chemotaxis protein